MATERRNASTSCSFVRSVFPSIAADYIERSFDTQLGEFKWSTERRHLTSGPSCQTESVAASSFNHEISDGIVSLRPSRPEDNEILVAGRDALFHRFMGEGHPEPDPEACITIGDDPARSRIVGWIDYDELRPWLIDGEVNVGYSVFAEYRGNGYATRALELLVRHLRNDPAVSAATLLIDPANEASIGVAHRAHFVRHDDVDGERFYKRQTVTPD